MDLSGRTSVEAAKKVIGENLQYIDDCRSTIADYQSEIDKKRESVDALKKKVGELRQKIHNLEVKIEDYEYCIKHYEEFIVTADSERFEYLVTNLALTQFIASGGGLDMIK